VDREPESSRAASLALGMLLLGADQVRAILEAARRELGGLPAEDPAGPDPGAAAPAGRALQPLIGAVFDAQRQALATGLAGARRGRGWLRSTRRTAAWAWQAPPLDRLRGRVEAETARLASLRGRVEAETARLASIGAVEEARARQFAAATVNAAIHRVTRVLLDQEFEEAYQRAIARMLETPEIAELVRQQSAGMAQELAESVRARAATGDEMIERLVGRVLRRSSGSGAEPALPPRADDGTEEA